jgi:LacI family transcriptional regulator
MVVTRVDVARAAGTSTAVVSYVMNNGPRPVAPATRERVLHAIDRLGYRPNRVAQALRGNRSFALGLIVPDIANPFYAELSRAVEDTAFAHGFTLIIGNTDHQQERERHYLDAFLDRKIDGVFLIPSAGSGPNLAALSRSGTPYILLDRRTKDAQAGEITLDNEQGGFMAATHLIEHGHRKVACIGGADALSRRYAGYTRAMRAAGLEPYPARPAAFSRAAGYDHAMAILGNKDRRPTAVFVCNDLLAFGLFRAAADLSLRIPEDIAVVGFDGIPEGAYSVPRLTTVEQPIGEISSRAVKRLVELINSESSEMKNISTDKIAPRILLRESCGCDVNHVNNVN